MCLFKTIRLFTKIIMLCTVDRLNKHYILKNKSTLFTGYHHALIAAILRHKMFGTSLNVARNDGQLETSMKVAQESFPMRPNCIPTHHHINWKIPKEMYLHSI